MARKRRYRKGRITRNLTKKECHRAFKKSQVVYEHTGYGAGDTAPWGIIVTLRPGRTPYCQVPKNAVQWDEE